MQLIEDIIKTREELAGIPVGSFHWSSRKQILTITRQCTCNYIMRELAIDYGELAKYITSRDRTTFCYWYNCHDDNMMYFDRYRVFYKALKAALQGENYHSFEHLDSAKFNYILQQNNIRIIEPNIPKSRQKVRFAITLGNFRANIYRSIENAPKCLKTILFAFARYNIDINIKKLQKNERIHQVTQKDSAKQVL